MQFSEQSTHLSQHCFYTFSLFELQSWKQGGISNVFSQLSYLRKWDKNHFNVKKHQRGWERNKQEAETEKCRENPFATFSGSLFPQDLVMQFVSLMG